MKKNFGIFGASFLLVFVVLSLRPVPILEEEDCEVLMGTVTEIHEGGVKDVVIKLRGYKQVFYINRGIGKRIKFK